MSIGIDLPEFDHTAVAREARFEAAVRRIDPTDLLQDAIDRGSLQDALLPLVKHALANPPEEPVISAYYSPSVPSLPTMQRVVWAVMLELDRSLASLLEAELSRMDLD